MFRVRPVDDLLEAVFQLVRDGTCVRRIEEAAVDLAGELTNIFGELEAFESG